MDGIPKSQGPARMSRSATGGAAYAGSTYGVGEHGGIAGDTIIKVTGHARSHAWNDVKKSSSRMGKAHTANPKNRWEHRSHNPSGASNIPDLGNAGKFADYDNTDDDDDDD